MRPDLANAAMQFLQRADLKGAEVPAFNEVMRALHALANQAPDAQGGLPATQPE